MTILRDTVVIDWWPTDRDLHRKLEVAQEQGHTRRVLCFRTTLADRAARRAAETSVTTEGGGARSSSPGSYPGDRGFESRPSHSAQASGAATGEIPTGDGSQGPTPADASHDAAPPSSPASPRAPEHKARRSDPQTAKDAATAIAPHVTPQQFRLLDAFRGAPNGLTAAAASEAAGVFYPSASTRITELEGKGLLVRTGDTRETPNGRQADVLVIAPSAIEAAGKTVAA